VAQPCTLGNTVLVPHLSIGVAILPAMEQFDETLNRADEAMYAAKAAGRNQVLTLDA
jgi:GGDEF domain-containing protein